MRVGLVLPLSLVLASARPAVSSGQQTVTQQAIAQRDQMVRSTVNALLDQYNAWFMAGRADSIANRIYLAPLIWLADNRVSVFSSRDEIRQQFEAISRTLMADGYARSDWSLRNICVLGDNAAILSGRFARYRKDGSKIGDYAATYTFAKTPDGWRIASIALHAPDRVIQCSS